MVDIRRDYDNYRTRKARFSVSNPSLEYKDNELILFHLPKNVLIQRIYTCVVQADSQAGATIDLVAVPAIPKPTFDDITNADVVLADEIDISTEGVKGCDTCTAQLLDKEMIIATRNGDVAGNADGAFSIVIEFLELNKKEDSLTRIPRLESEMILE